MFDKLTRFIRDQYRMPEGIVPLHAPIFQGQERAYIVDTIDSSFVSSVGAYVERFEREIASYVGSPRAVATVNGTAALHVALKLADLMPGELVITQPLTFVATCNAIAYCQAEPVFVDVDQHTLGMSPKALEAWLDEYAQMGDDGLSRSKAEGKIIRAVVPMHTFGHPVELDAIIDVCKRWNLQLIEDAAESLGSFYKGQHTGTFGQIGTLSFNGNKIITTGGGGMIIANDAIGARAKYLTTTAKNAHPYEYVHNEIGFNYRLPNINAALGCAQLERLESFIAIKRELANRYAKHFEGSDLKFFNEPKECRSNYWLNAVLCENRAQRNALLEATNDAGVITRPVWTLMNNLPMYINCKRGELTNAQWLEERIVSLPSGVLPDFVNE